MEHHSTIRLFDELQREVKKVYIPIRIIFSGLLFYAVYRFGKAVGKEETRQLITD